MCVHSLFLFFFVVSLGPFVLFLVSFLPLSEFWPPSEISGCGENSLPPSVSNMGFAFRAGMMPSVLFHVTLECTLWVVLRCVLVVGVVKVCGLLSCYVFNFSVAVLNIFQVVLMLFYASLRLHSALLAFVLLRW